MLIEEMTRLVDKKLTLVKSQAYEILEIWDNLIQTAFEFENDINCSIVDCGYGAGSVLLQDAVEENPDKLFHGKSQDVAEQQVFSQEYIQTLRKQLSDVDYFRAVLIRDEASGFLDASSAIIRGQLDDCFCQLSRQEQEIYKDKERVENQEQESFEELQSKWKTKYNVWRSRYDEFVFLKNIYVRAGCGLPIILFFLLLFIGSGFSTAINLAFYMVFIAPIAVFVIWQIVKNKAKQKMQENISIVKQDSRKKLELIDEQKTAINSARKRMSDVTDKAMSLNYVPMTIFKAWLKSQNP